MIAEKRDKNINSIEDYICRYHNISTIDELDAKKDYLLETSEVIDILEKHKDDKICALADYDVDGITAACEFDIMLKNKGFNNYSIRFPKRISEGYGMSKIVLEEFLNQKPTLVVLFDNGITAVEYVKELRENDIEVLIIDHHLIRDDGMIPDANVILDPHVFPEQCEYDDYCTAGLMYKIAQNWGFDKSVLNTILSFAAIGTIADVVTLHKDNRLIVKNGLCTLKNSKYRTTGLTSLLMKLYLAYGINESDIGYKVGPCINALGRLEDDGAKIVFDALSLDDPNDDIVIMDKANDNSDFLIAKNNERKQIVEEYMPIAEDIIKNTNQQNDKAMLVKMKNIPEGIVGIIAGNISQKYKNVCIIFSESDNRNFVKGSGRAYNNTIHLKKTLDNFGDLLLSFGGHSGAAGLSINVDNYDAFYKAFKKKVEQANFSIDTKKYYDFCIFANDVKEWVDKKEKYAPYGQGCPDIEFYIKDYVVDTKQGSFQFFGKNPKLVKMNNGENFILINHLTGNEFMGTKYFSCDCITTVAKKTFKEEINYTMIVTEPDIIKLVKTEKDNDDSEVVKNTLCILNDLRQVKTPNEVKKHNNEEINIDANKRVSNIKSMINSMKGTQ